MTTVLTRERLGKFLMDRGVPSLTREEQEELALYAMASLSQSPLCYIFLHPDGKLFWSVVSDCNAGHPGVIPVYPIGGN